MGPRTAVVAIARTLTPFTATAGSVAAVTPLMAGSLVSAVSSPAGAPPGPDDMT